MRILKNLLLVFVIVWGLLALLVRSATPLVADYREEIAAALSAQLGTPVSIDALKARWYGLSPLLECHGVTLGAPPQAVKVSRISLDLALGELFSGSPLGALRVTLDGMQLTVVREPSGQLHLEGVGVITPGNSTGPVPSHLRLVNTDIVWIDRKAGKAPLRLDNVSVLLDRDGRQLKLRARLDTGAGRADLSAQLKGYLGTREWSGETYLKVDNLDVAELFAHYLPNNYGLRSLQLDLESWSQWREAAPIDTRGEFTLRRLDLQPLVQDAGWLAVPRASARFTVQRGPPGLRIGLRDLEMDFGDHQWPRGDLAFVWSAQDGGVQRLEAAADYLHLEDLTRILRVRLPWEGLREPLAALRPQGELHDLRVTADIGPTDTAWRTRAKFEGITLAAWGDAPGVENLSGQLHGQQDHLAVQIASRDAAIRFNGLFRDPLELLELTGRIDLSRQGEGWQVLSEDMLADTPHIKTHTRVRLEQQPQGPLLLDLQTDFRDGDAAFALRYFPAGIMSSTLVEWLDSSIRSGRVAAGTALVHGPLDAFPFEQPRSGTFQVIFDTQDIQLDYRDGWPKLEQLDAHVRFHANSLDIEVGKGAVYDSRLLEARAHIPSLNPSSHLQVHGRLSGPLHDNLRVLQEEALAPSFGRFASALRGGGNSELLMDFTLPLSEQASYALDGLLTLDGARLSLPEWDLTLSGIRGALAFDLAGLRAQGISAQVLGAPVVIDVLPVKEGATRVQARGTFRVDEVGRLLPDVPFQFADGGAEFSIAVDVPPASADDGSPTMLSVNSNLEGIGIRLPPPFAKPAAEARPLAVTVPLGGRPTPGSLSYGDRLEAAFSSDGQQVDVMLGGEAARLGGEPGIRIGGALQQVDLAAWGAAAQSMSLEGNDRDTPLSLDLRIHELLADAVSLRQLQLRATRDRGQWQGAVEAPNLAGRFSASEPLVEAPVQVDLERLSLSLPVGGDSAELSPQPDPGSGPDPTTLPGLSLNIADLRINDAKLGRLRLDAQRAPEGLRFTELSLSGGQIELESAGYWSRPSGGYETQLGGHASTANLGDLLVDLGYSRQAEEAGSRIEFLLTWPGNPAQFHRATVSGDLRLDVGPGRLVELDPGATRVVGLLNLNALTRRLRLDFSDFYKKGYSFDRIKGAFAFAAGEASTDGLSVTGPTGRIDIRGSTDLVERRLQQHVTVTPNLDATLPIAGTLAGGPIAGIAVLVAQTVMSKQVDDIYRFEYSVNGPWVNPEIKPLDTGGTLSKLLKPFQAGDTDPGKPAEPPPEDTTAAPVSPAETDAEPQAEDGTASETSPATAPAQADDGARKPNMVNKLIDFLRDSEPHGGELPGE